MARAPQAIKDFYTKITVSSKVLSGIVGDASHSYGYHLARNELPSNDYSVVLAADKLGASDCASAIDVSLSRTDMILVSKRLLAAGKGNDSRLHAMREFFGADSTDTHVIGWDRHDPNNAFDDTPTTSDDSHLWHIHISFYRQYADNLAAITPIADVFNGKAVDAPMSASEVATIKAALAASEKRVLAAVAENDRILTLLVHGDSTHPNSQDGTGPVIRQIATDVAAIKNKPTS